MGRLIHYDWYASLKLDSGVYKNEWVIWSQTCIYMRFLTVDSVSSGSAICFYNFSKRIKCLNKSFALEVEYNMMIYLNKMEN